MTSAVTCPCSLSGLVARARRRLREAGVPGADLDARVLACAAAGAKHVDLLANGGMLVDAETETTLDRHVDRRVSGEPVSRIVGHREFWSLCFDISPAVLDPRADSETIIEAVLELAESGQEGERFRRVCDLGTGSGCLLIALMTELDHAVGVGVDICPDALRIARHNAATHKVEHRAHFVCADWTAPLSGGFDLIVSNPPYIRSGDIAALKPEVRRHDPLQALDGGADGLDAYRRVISGARTLVDPGGWLVVEAGAGQAAEVKHLMKAEGFRLDDSFSSVVCDMAGVERCVRAQARIP